MRRIVVFLTALGLIGIAWPAMAMGFRQEVQPVAWSDDGQSVLLEVTGHGPEGGGYKKFRVVSGKEEGFMVEPDNDASPGDGSTPQWIPAKQCRKGMKKLAAVLKRLGFGAVEVNLKECDKDDRHGFLKITGKDPRAVRLEGDEGSLEVGGLTISLNGNSLLIKDGDRQVQEQRELFGVNSLAVYLSPSKRMLLVVGRGDHVTSLLLAVLVRSKEGSKDWKVVVAPGNKG